MKHVDEFRDRDRSERLLGAIAATVTKPWSIMEICGGQTHAIVRYGIDQLLPDSLSLIHGPGCPVCVTASELIDQAIELALTPNVLLTTFGDMARVPGSSGSLIDARARGGQVQWVYSPLDAVRLAREQPERQVVFFAVGFETTAPATALAVHQAKELGVGNFSVLAAHVRVPPAMVAMLSEPDCRINGFLAAGHVCTIMGVTEYPPIAQQFGVPIIITGFEPVDILQGLLSCVRQLEAGEAIVDNQYQRAVRDQGNDTALKLMQAVFEPVGRQWRGIGSIPNSGLGLSTEYASFDARTRFDLAHSPVDPARDQACGQVLKGVIKPAACQKFGRECNPEHPVGAPMVSSEGACAAYYRHRGQPVGAVQPE